MRASRRELEGCRGPVDLGYHPPRGGVRTDPGAGERSEPAVAFEAAREQSPQPQAVDDVMKPPSVTSTAPKTPASFAITTDDLPSALHVDFLLIFVVSSSLRLSTSLLLHTITLPSAVIPLPCPYVLPTSLHQRLTATLSPLNNLTAHHSPHPTHPTTHHQHNNKKQQQ